MKPPSEKCNDFQILPNPRADQDGYRRFTKYVNVLDCWSVFAEDGISDEKVFSKSASVYSHCILQLQRILSKFIQIVEDC